MRTVLLVALSLGGLIPRSWANPGMMLADPLKGIEELFNSAQYVDVIGRLQGPEIQKLKRRYRARAYWLLGKSHERAGQVERALGVYQLAEGLYPKDLDILSALANLLHRIELDERARPRYELVLQIHPNNADAHKGLAEIFRKQGLLERAELHYQAALKELEKDPLVWRDYAEVLAERQKFSEAIRAIHRSLDLAFDEDSLLALAVFERRQGHPGAYPALEEAIRKAPERADLRLRRGLWLLEDGDLEGAQATAWVVLKRSPDDPLGRWLKAAVELRMEEFAAAASDLRVAAAASRTDPFVARVAQTMLEELEGKK